MRDYFLKLVLIDGHDCRVLTFILDLVADEIEPCDDFFEYACQNWIKTYPMPNGKILFTYV